jgi:hypothetical protein
VAQAFQPVPKRGEGWCRINDPQFSKMLFMKDIKLISFRFNPLSAQAGSLWHQIPWGSLMESRWKDTFASGALDNSAWVFGPPVRHEK